MAKLGEIKLQSPNGPETLPIYEPSNIGSGVYDVVRVMTEKGVGVIPFTDPESATYKFLKIKTENNGIISAHGESSLLEIIEDFEDGDISEYSGDKGAFTVVEDSSEAPEGNYYLSSSGVNNAAISSTSGLESYPQQGETFSVYLKAMSTSDGSGQPGVIWAAQGEYGWSNRNWYYLSLQVGGSGMSLYYSSGGTNQSVIASTGTSNLQSDHWYRVKIFWGTDGTMECTLFDENENELGALSAKDNNYSSGGFGWIDNDDNGNEVRFGYAYKP